MSARDDSLPELRRRPKGAAAAADFSVVVTDDSMRPYIAPGDTVYVSRAAPLMPGDAGVFYVSGQMVCRQYVEDIAGNIYLFAANRSRRDLDITVSAGSGTQVQLFGAVVPRLTIPLPGIDDVPGAK